MVVCYSTPYPVDLITTTNQGRKNFHHGRLAVNTKRPKPTRPKSASAATQRRINEITLLDRWKQEEMASPRPQIPPPGQAFVQICRTTDGLLQHDCMKSHHSKQPGPECVMAPDEVASQRIQAAMRGWLIRARLRAEWNLGPNDRLKVGRLIFCLEIFWSGF